MAVGNGSVPVPSDFVDHWLTETDYFDHWPEAAQAYFNQEEFGRGLALDFATMTAPAGGIFVCSNP